MADACYRLPASHKICPIVGEGQLRLQLSTDSIPEVSNTNPSSITSKNDSNGLLFPSYSLLGTFLCTSVYFIGSPNAQKEQFTWGKKLETISIIRSKSVPLISPCLDLLFEYLRKPRLPQQKPSLIWPRTVLYPIYLDLEWLDAFHRVEHESKLSSPTFLRAVMRLGSWLGCSIACVPLSQWRETENPTFVPKGAELRWDKQVANTCVIGWVKTIFITGTKTHIIRK